MRGEVSVQGALRIGDKASGSSDVWSRAVAPHQKIRRQVFVLIFVTLACRLVFAAAMPLGVDETYTVVTSRFFDWSYFDHPPLAWWIELALQRMGAAHSALLLRLPFIGLFALSTWLMYRLTGLLYGERAGFWAALALNLAPALSVTSGSWILPDGPLIASMLGSAYFTASALFERDTLRTWLAAGICAGFALLSKYHGVFLPAGIAAFLVSQPSYRALFCKRGIYVAGIAAFVLSAPVFIWNVQHHWVSLHFQVSRASVHGLHPLAPLETLLGQALFLTPWIWCALLWAAYRSLRPARETAIAWYLCCLAAGPILVFTLTPFWSASRPMFHWAMPGYLFLFPLLGAEIDAGMSNRRWFQVGLGMAGTVLALALLLTASEIRFAWVEALQPSFAWQNRLLQETSDWNEVRNAVVARGLDRNAGFVSGTKWNTTAKLDYALAGVLPVRCVCREPHEYAYRDDLRSLRNQSGLIIGPDLTLEQARTLYGSSFETLAPLEPIVLEHAGYPVTKLSVYLGRKFRPQQ